MTVRRPALAVALAMTVLAPLAAGAECGDPIDLGRGPVEVRLPDRWDGSTPAPLLLLLHGYGSSARLQEAYMRLGPVARKRGLLYAVPDGTRDPSFARFWNATDACCDLYGSGVDDSAYLRELIDAIAAQCPVDPFRIYLLGHSNGGFMAYRMACDHAERIAGIASLAGATWADPAACAPAEPVHVLQLHGTEDGSIDYEGGAIRGVRYPGARQTAATWAAYAGCGAEPEALPGRLNLDRLTPGRETSRESWAAGCDAGGSAELWTLAGSPHIPALRRAFRRGVIGYLLDHPKCRGREKVRPPVCDTQGRSTVALRRGVPGDRFTVTLDGAVAAAGRLDERGRASVPLAGLPSGEHEIALRWGCGAVAQRAVSCP